MERLIGKLMCGLLAVAFGGCANTCGLSPCTGGCRPCGMGLFEGLLVPPCGQCPIGACSDCGGEPCSCTAPAGPIEGCAAPAEACEGCAAPVASCESCSTPVFSLCRPRLLQALFGCTGCDGEYYWSEWFSDPPACHDPCDDCGNWTGYCSNCGEPSAAHVSGPAIEEIAVP